MTKKSELDARIAEMDAANLPDEEVLAAAMTYERLLTARVIANSVLTQATNSDVLAVLAELSRERRFTKASG